MEYKYYIQEGDEYALKPASGPVFYLGLFVWALGGILLCFLGYKSGSVGVYIGGMACLLIFAWIIFRKKTGRPTFYIQPALKKVVKKKRNGDIKNEYAFDQFLNFHTLSTYTNGILTGRQVTIIFDENGKNKRYILAMVYRKKTAERVIAETTEIMGK